MKKKKKNACGDCEKGKILSAEREVKDMTNHS